MINLNTKEFLEFCHSAFDNIPIAIDFLDKDGKMIYINKSFSDFLQIPIENMIGRIVTDINPTSKFMKSLKNKRADIATPHKFPNGKEAICHRIPIIDDRGNLVGGLGMILFEEIQNMKDILDKYELLNKELKLYKNEIAKFNKTTYSLDNIIGKSSSIIKCKNDVKKFAKVKFDVLIKGESGVGKELFAHAIHAESERHNMPFVRIDCSSIPESLLESEFFGYEEGSFTGTKKGGSIGKFELANGGTIFLDEIGEMPYHMQAKLLRVLQEKEIIRIGGKKVIPLDIRVISATNRNLEKMVIDGKFREDLYYRINVLSIEVPPLRERKEDMKFLVEEFLSNFHKELGILRKIPDNIMDILNEYLWPGNIRELKNVINKICVSADDVNVGINDLPEFFLQDSIKQNINLSGMGLNEVINAVEAETIKSALSQCNYNKSQAAKLLKIPRNTLYRKINELNIKDI
ncbi:sigma-54 interaction domain-containing protein [Clostridium brassicae]|uniref:Sigma 54-interacting transcriptional regulator n=1 Tax=Clostridium brassicae TaxID=2999072 RepID=A0ABT4DG01_9CLOT|nr:sigma 54-interacting transcriptional regulator [Clostridium brassicae]MCY6960141.1 sigma 54-interacting transcriptional regulator [Clostridium brassicae]